MHRQIDVARLHASSTPPRDARTTSLERAAEAQCATSGWPALSQLADGWCVRRRHHQRDPGWGPDFEIIDRRTPRSDRTCEIMAMRVTRDTRPAITPNPRGLKARHLGFADRLAVSKRWSEQGRVKVSQWSISGPRDDQSVPRTQRPVGQKHDA